jgi:hypothetical protein
MFGFLSSGDDRAGKGKLTAIRRTTKSMRTFMELPIYADRLEKHLDHCGDDEPGTDKKLAGRCPKTTFLDIERVLDYSALPMPQP